MQITRPGIEPGPAASGTAVRSGTPTGCEHPDLESNQGLGFRRALCGP